MEYMDFYNCPYVIVIPFRNRNEYDENYGCDVTGEYCQCCQCKLTAEECVNKGYKMRPQVHKKIKED